MNRSILIIICDFLLVSLLVFSTPDIKKVGEDSLQQDAQLNVRTNRVNAGEDLGDLMKLALQEEQKAREELLAKLASTEQTAEERQALLDEELKAREALLAKLASSEQTAEQRQALLNEEQKAREALLAKLATTRAVAEQNQALLAERQALLNARAEQLQAAQQKLEEQEQAAALLQQQQQRVQQQFSLAQSSIENLNQQLQTRSRESLLTKEQLAAKEEELRKREEAAAELKQQLTQLAQSNQVVLQEKQQLSTQLQVAEVEKRHATEQVVAMREQVEIERTEKARLVEGVKALASSSGELAQEIRQHRPLASNTIFNQFLTNRVSAQFIGVRDGLFGEASKNREIKTVLVKNGTNTFAVCHVEDTPFTFGDPGTDWKDLGGALGRSKFDFPIESLSFSFKDPRVVLIPVPPAEVGKLGCKVYTVETDPYKFQEAVLVGANDGYYGECRFEIDLKTPGYLKLDRNFVKGLFGKFNPSRGDLVFSQTGELLGIMVNNTYCLQLQNFETVATLKFGRQALEQRTGDTLSALYRFVFSMRPELR